MSRTQRRGITGRSVRFCVAVLLLLAPRVAARGTAPPPSDTVILADPADPYYALAEEIAQREALPIVHALDDVLARDPTFLLWIVSPSRLSDQGVADFGSGLRGRSSAISVGIISGSTLEKARELWQREFSPGGRSLLSAVAREGRLSVLDGGRAVVRPLTKENLIAAIQDADYLIFHGHGSRRYLRLDEETLLVPGDIPSLAPIVVSAAACQTFRPWKEGSIALGFTDRGAAAYTGFVHSPTGYLIGEPDRFPFRYTWPDFPIGHVVQLQNRGLLQGFLHFPFYLLVGDPRLSFQTEAAYELVDDYEDEESGVRVLSYANAPEGVIPVRIARGARYGFVEIPAVGAAWQGDPFYSGALQMADIGDDKYLLFVHEGGDFTVRLRPRPPWYWAVVDPFTGALDHESILHHAEGGVVPNLIVVGIPLIAVGWLLVRGRGSPRTYLPAVATGLGLTALRGVYALVRLDQIRTIDGTFKISPLCLVTTFLLAGCGAMLFLNARSRWGKGSAVLTATFPNWAIAGFWFGAVTVMNVLARHKLGVGLYGYGRCCMALIAFAFECSIVVVVLSMLHRATTAKFRSEVPGGDSAR